MIKIKLTSVPTIHVVSVAYERFNEMKIFVQSWINQTEKNWKLTVIHDGNNPEFIRLMESTKQLILTVLIFSVPILDITIMVIH